MPERVRRNKLPRGESLPALFKPGSAPAPEPIRRVISILGIAGRAENTIEAHMGATAAGPVWARSNGFSLEARSATGARFELGEVESPSHTLKAAGFRIGRRPPPGQCPAAFPIGQGGEAHRRLGHNRDEMPRHQIGADRVRFVAACLDWLASHSRAAGSQ